MKEEDELLKKCGTKNPFMVPEGYFDNFSKELMNIGNMSHTPFFSPFFHCFDKCG